VKITRFLIDEHEVTVGRFRTWWTSPTRSWPVSNQLFFTGAKDLRWRMGWPTAPTEPPTTGGCFWKGATDSSNDDKPMNCVDWYTAEAFCIGDNGKRLPTEAEWELAASSGDDSLFPWSPPMTEDDPLTPVECVHALWGGTCTPATASPTSTIWGRTRFGVWNMAGSLAEWTIDGYAASHSGTAAGTVDPVNDPGTLTTRMVRGGSWVSMPAAMLRAAARPTSGASATTPDAQIGFRCVKRA
jgi:iron(II)-dependent oxidoreductase